ncbi:LacI family DNA-binding transcriptional regulator [Streptomyces castrisilvae]|uniref:LacI family DNA-binding transcriptional regulator n=1 Tax=Streptomyces castrisilvae TaxID=3033811 RepID=A0ABY9HQQ7_9ACTN|nr:LacI family DNA-binding transcriptional regulator [Streptomyces sp. Mut1]WLQ36887.1 LacI family DNA-binding transcriptional regulator [Streptomyces sp. Mut1]
MGRRPGARITIRAIAEEAGVSIATVSRVINGRAVVAPATQEMVRQAARRLGEVPVQRRPSPGPADAPVLVYCPYALTDYFGTIVTSVIETLALHGRRAVIQAGESAREQTPSLLSLPGPAGMAGAVLILPPSSTEDLLALHARRYPLVVIDPREELPEDVASVSAAHAAGARRVTGHLTALGHRRIGFIGGPGNWLASRSRLVGHTSALAEIGILVEPELVRAVVEPNAEMGYRAASSLLELAPAPTAIVAFNDKTAAGALRAALDRRLRVPQDLSVTGFDDSELGRSTSPILTTARQPLEEMGRIAVSLLMRLVAGHAVDTLHVELATPLLVRASTGRPRSEPSGPDTVHA